MIECPTCGRKYGWRDELEGRKVRCKCGEKFMAAKPMGGPAADLRPKPPTRRAPPPTTRACPSCSRPVGANARLCVHCGTDLTTGKRVPLGPSSKSKGEVGLQLTGIGLAIHVLGAVIVVLSVLAGAAAGIMVQQAPNSPWLQPALLLAGFGTLGGLGLSAAGPLLCLGVPSEHGRPLVIVAIVGFALSIGLEVAAEYAAAGTTNRMIFWGVALKGIATVVSLGATACFLGFLQQLTILIDNDTLHERTVFLLKTLFFIIGMVMLSWVPILGCLAALAAAIAQIVFGIAYVFTTGQIALAVLRR